MLQETSAKVSPSRRVMAGNIVAMVYGRPILNAGLEHHGMKDQPWPLRAEGNFKFVGE
jgi:hypothetical protein